MVLVCFYVMIYRNAAGDRAMAPRGSSYSGGDPRGEHGAGTAAAEGGHAGDPDEKPDLQAQVRF